MVFLELMMTVEKQLVQKKEKERKHCLHINENRDCQTIVSLGIIIVNPPEVRPVFTLPTHGLKLYTFPT